MKPKTRLQMIKEADARVFSAINALTSAPEFRNDQQSIVGNELARMELETDEKTTSDAWYDLSENLQDETARALAFKVAQAVLVRNGYHDGLPFCPLCGKLGNPEHNGAPVIDAQVCEACNQRKVIPARIREAQREGR